MDLQGPDDNFLFLGTRIGSLKHLKKKLCLIFLDLSKAFNTVNHKVLSRLIFSVA